jgi:hypothetical protein
MRGNRACFENEFSKEGGMGPLQYMVVGFDGDYFGREILPELVRLSKKNVIRVVDLLFVTRDANGDVTSRELAQMLPDHASLLASGPHLITETFTQDDIDVVGASIPDDTTVALLLFEHRWASRLDQAVHHMNTTLTGTGPRFDYRVVGIEQTLASMAGASRSI